MFVRMLVGGLLAAWVFRRQKYRARPLPPRTGNLWLLFKEVEKSCVEAVQNFDIRRFKPFYFTRPIYTVDEIEATWLYPYLLGMQNANEALIRGHTASSA